MAQSNDTNARRKELELELLKVREKHERWLDKVAVCLLIGLAIVSVLVLGFYMIGGAFEWYAKKDDNAISWAMTFLTTLGGVTIGVLARSARSKLSDQRDAESANQPADREENTNAS